MAITDFPFRIGPINNITPFTYRDGVTYLEILYKLRDYINDTLRPEFDAEMERIIEEFTAGIENAENTIIEYKTNIDAAIAAFEAGVNADIAAHETAVDTRMDAAETDINTAKTGWQTLFNQFMADVEAELAALSDAAMGGLIGNPASETAIALAKVSHKVINVKKYGAKGDGVTDDRAAFQSAIDEALSFPNGATIVVDNGNYLIGSPGIVIPTHAKNIIMRGSGMGATGRYGTVLTRTGAFPVITARGDETAPTTTAKVTAAINLYDLTLHGNNFATPVVWFSIAAGYVWERVRIAYSAAEAFLGTQLWNVRHHECLFETSGVLASDIPAVRLNGTTHEGTNTVHLIGCHFEGNLGDDLLLDGNINTYPTVGVMVTACKFERALGAAIRFRKAQSNTINNCYLYSNTSGAVAVFETGAIRNSVDGNVVGGGAATTYLFDLLGGTHNIVANNTIYSVGTAAIHIGANYASTPASYGMFVVIAGNAWEQGAGTFLVDDRTVKKGFIQHPDGATFGSGGGNASLAVDGATGGLNQLVIRSAGVDRWRLRKLADSASGNLTFIGIKDDASTVTVAEFERATGNGKFINTLEAAAHFKHSAPTGTVGFYGTTPIGKPQVTGSRTGESAANASLRAALVALGLITDNTTA
jgi:hypothetical protein